MDGLTKLKHLTHDVRNNSTDTVDLNFFESTCVIPVSNVYLEELFNAIRNHKGIKTVSIRSSLVKHISETMKDVLFASIGSLPNLRKLEIDYANRVLPIGMLVKALEKSKAGIGCIEVKCCTITARMEDADIFVPTLQKCCSLQKISLTHVNFQQSFQFQSFITVLSKLPKLYHFDWSMTDSIDKELLMISNALQSNFNAIERFTLRAISDMRRSTKISLAQSLACKCSVRHLDFFWSNIDNDAIKCLIERLRENIPLKSLFLAYTDISDIGCLQIAEVLKSEKSRIEEIDIRGCPGITDVGCIAFAEAMKSNKALKNLIISENRNITSVGYKSLSDSLEENLSIFEVKHDDTEYRSKIELYLTLNKYNRSNFLRDENEGASRDQYISNMIRGNLESGNLLGFSMIYYWMKAKPSLIFQEQHNKNLTKRSSDLTHNSINKKIKNE